MSIINGVGRIGIRSYVAVSQQITTSTLLNSLYSVWNADTLGTSLDTSIFGAWNAEASNNITVKNAWNANGNVNDSKGTANGTIAAPSGTTFVTGTMSFGTGKLGSGAFTFNGSNFISLPADTLSFTGDFSVSMWVYIPSLVSSTSYIALLSAFDNKTGYTTVRGWRLFYYNNQIDFRLGETYSTNPNSTLANMTLRNQWVHIVATRKSSSLTTIYINGVQAAQTNNSVNPIYNSNNLAYIGASFYGFSQPYYSSLAPNGVKIDSIQTWETILDQTAVTELYNSGNGQQYPFTVSNALIPSPKDSVGTNHGTLMNGTTFTTGKVGQTFTFDGVDDYVALPNDTFKLTGNFSISTWVKLNTVGATRSILVSGTGTSNGFRMYTSTNNKIYFEYNGSYFNGTTALVANTWYNIVLSNDGSIFKLYINGTLDATNASFGSAYQTITWATSGTNLAMIGRYISNAYYFNGTIDGTTIWTKALVGDEITQLYNADNGTQYPFSSQTLSSSANQLGVDNGTLMNGCTFTDGKIGKAFTFDGVNDYIDLPNNSMNFTGDFSVSGWINQSSIKPYHMIIGNQGTSTGNWHGWLVWVFNNKLTFDLYNGNSAVASGRWQSTSTLDANTWIHFTITKKPNQAVKIYLNGVINGGLLSGSNSANVTYTTTNYATIGLNKYSNTIVSSDAGYWNGKIDTINVWQREITQAEVTELYNSGAGKQLTPTPIVTNGLVLNLDASRSSSYPNTGTTWFDISGNVNNGTLTNGPIFATANGGQITFDGINDYVVTSDTPFRFSNKFTISIWFYWDGLDKTNKSILGKRSGPGGNYAQYAMGINNGDVQYGGTGKVLFFYARVDGSVGGNDPLDVIMTYTLPSTSGIYNVSVTMDSNIQNLYINGVLVTSSAKNLVGKTYNISGREFLIGANRDDAGTGALAHFNGKIYSVYVYGRTLTDSEINQNFNATKSRFGL